MTAAGTLVLLVAAGLGAEGSFASLDASAAALLWLLILCELLGVSAVGRRPGVFVSSTAFVFALLLMQGTAVAVVGIALACATSELARRLLSTEGRAAAIAGTALGSAETERLRREATGLKNLFDAAQNALAWGAAGVVLHVLLPRGAEGLGLLQGNAIAAVLASGATYFILNYAFVGVAVALERADKSWSDVRAGLLPAVADEIGPLCVGLLIAAAGVRVATIPLLVFPFVISLGARSAMTEHHQALHDPLTGLVSRALFTDRAQQAVRQAERTGIGGSILLIDLDGFKNVNDTFGHHTGDAVLQEVANRLRATVRATDTVGRLGGDEFAVLLADQVSLAGTERIVGDIAAVIEQPIVTDSHACTVGASIGSVSYPADGFDVASLLRHADEGMYRAKHRRRTAATLSRDG